MSSNTTKMCNGCGTTIEADQAQRAGWLDLTIKLVDYKTRSKFDDARALLLQEGEVRGASATMSEIDVCPSCTPAFVGVLPKLEQGAREILLARSATPAA